MAILLRLDLYMLASAIALLAGWAGSHLKTETLVVGALLGSSQVAAQHARRIYTWRQRDPKSAPEPAALVAGANAAAMLTFTVASAWLLHAFNPVLEPPSLIEVAAISGACVLVGVMISFERIWSFGEPPVKR